MTDYTLTCGDRLICNIDAFNAFLFQDIVHRRPEDYPDAQGPLAKTHGCTWRVVFARGNLGPHNILWKDWRIVSIIDWECAGWFLEVLELYENVFRLPAAKLVGDVYKVYGSVSCGIGSGTVPFCLLHSHIGFNEESTYTSLRICRMYPRHHAMIQIVIRFVQV